MLPFLHRISFVNEVLYHYLVRTGSLSNTFTLDSIKIIESGFLSTLNFYKNSNVNKAFYDIVEASAFLRLGIAATTRVSIQNKKSKNSAIAMSNSFLNTHFAKWASNKYLSLKMCCRYGIKSFAVWVAKILFKMHAFGLFIDIYALLTNKCHKDIKW
jgi:hypothetical protein